MIKNFCQISEKDLNYLVSNDFEIYEKLDMCYFRVEITPIGAFATKNSLGKCISDIDCITNNIYKDICDFVETYINPYRNEFIKNHGSATLGFFYLPIEKYHKITYYIKHKFIYSDNLNNIPEDDIFNEFSLLNKSCLHKPLIAKVSPELNSKLSRPSIETYKEYIEGKINEVELVNYFCNITNTGTFSGNEPEDIEGIIIRNDKFQYQVKLNDIEDNIDKSTKKIYRDTLLKSVVNDFMQSLDAMNIASSKHTYIEKVCELFLLYINNTDLFTKYSFDPEDLLPPASGYIGDLDFEMINDNNVKLICKYNEVNKNIFRIFLYTFTKNISEDKFNFLSNEQKIYLKNLIIALNYKNYKEIMLNAYKANH